MSVMSLKTLVRWTATTLIAMGAAMLAYVGFVFLDAWAYRFEYRQRTSVAGTNSAARSVPAPAMDGDAIGEIHIARLGLSEVISQGESATALRRGVGHLADSAWLGEAGNIALAGHRDTVFRALRNIRVGDRIDVTTKNRHAQYEVQSAIVVSPADVGVVTSSGANTLTLITCYPFTFIGAAPNRFVVRATEVVLDSPQFDIH